VNTAAHIHYRHTEHCQLLHSNVLLSSQATAYTVPAPMLMSTNSANATQSGAQLTTSH
jgi:hypothetical protein